VARDFPKSVGGRRIPKDAFFAVFGEPKSPDEAEEGELLVDRGFIFFGLFGGDFEFLRLEGLRALLLSFEGEGEQRIMDFPKQGFDGVIFAACLSAMERVCFT